MADKQISEFPLVGAPEDTDEFLVQQNGVTKKESRSQIVADATAHTSNLSNPHSVDKTQIGLSNVTDDAQLKIASDLSDVNDTVTARGNIGAAAQTNLDSHITNISNPHVVAKTQLGLGNVTDDAQLKAASDLADVNDAATARSNLGAGSQVDIDNHIANTSNPHTVTKAQLGLDNVTNDAQLKAASDLADIGDAAAARINLGVSSQTDLNNHIANTSNPHSITKSQMGLSNVTDDAQLTIASNLADVNDVATARSNLGAAAQADVTSHITNTLNPHGVDKNQIGLSNVTDDAQLKIASDLADLNDPAIALTNLGAAAQADLDAHTTDISNPHSVDKVQVGLGNVTDDPQLKIASNLADLNNPEIARTNLGLDQISKPNFIPHSLFTNDSDADGIPDLWNEVDGTYITGKLLETSEVFGFANKIVLTLDNSSGSIQYDGITLPGIIPPNTVLTFSTYIKSVNLNTKLRIKNGASDIDSPDAVHAAAERVILSGTLDAVESTTDLTLLIEIPDGTTAETVEIHLPMLNVGDKVAAFSPAFGEMGQLLLAGDLYILGKLKTPLDCNQQQLQQMQMHLQTSDPASAVKGEFWFDDSTGKKRPRFYDGTVNEDVSVAKQTKDWTISGTLSVGTELGGVWIVPRSLTMEKAYIYCKNTGTADSTIVDINKNGVTIFTTQANRPTLAFDDADKKAESGTLDVTDIVEGDIVSIDIDQIAVGAEDLSVILICR